MTLPRRLEARVLRSVEEFDSYARSAHSAFARAEDLRLPNDAAYLGAMIARVPSGAAQVLVLEANSEPWAVVPAFQSQETWDGIEVAVRGTPAVLDLDLSDVLLAPSARTAAGFGLVMRELLDLRETDAARLIRVPTRSHLELGIGQYPGSVSRRDAGRNAWCDVSSPEALASLSKSQLRNVERLERRAEREFGAVVVQSVTSAEDLSEAFERFLAIEDSGWKGVQGTGTSLLHDETLREFLRSAAERFAAVGRARIDFLSLGGRDAAVQLGFRTGDTWFLQKIGYHPDFKDVGPGAILLRNFLVQMTLDTEIREVNFMTDPRWADRWHFQTEACHDIIIHGGTLRGHALAVSSRLRDVARVVRNQLIAAPTPDSQ